MQKKEECIQKGYIYPLGSFAMNNPPVNLTQASVSQPVKKRIAIIDPKTGKDILQETSNEETEEKKVNFKNQVSSPDKMQRVSTWLHEQAVFKDNVASRDNSQASTSMGPLYPHVLFSSASQSLTAPNIVAHCTNPFGNSNISRAIHPVMTSAVPQNYIPVVTITDRIPPPRALAPNIIVQPMSPMSTVTSTLPPNPIVPIAPEQIVQLTNESNKSSCISPPYKANATQNSEICESKSSTILHDHKILSDLKELFFRKEDCDVIIRVKGQEFPAHKIILKSRSRVFASTFRNNMKERATGIVDIEDCDPSAFSDFLCFLYCGDVDVISQENVFNLFTAADKYDVQDLRAKCIEFIKKNISVNTFCETITLALLHSETELIKCATEFFTKNAPEIILTVKWQLFLAENPTQSNELLVKLLAPNKNLYK